MTRFMIGMGALLALVPPCPATSYSRLSLPELVGRADVIVLGTVVEAGPTYRVRVDRALAGAPGRELTYPRGKDGFLRPGQTRLLFLTSGPSGLALISPVAHEDPAREDDVRRLLALKADPAKYLADPKTADTPEYLEVLGWAFARRERVGRLARPAAVEHLRKSLASRNPEAVLRAVDGLRRVGCRESATSVVPLLRHGEERVALEAVRYLEWAGDRRAVGPLCETLDRVRVPRDVAAEAARALGRLRDPAAAPALERAVRRGLDGWSGWALATVGDERAFELLLSRAEDHDVMDAVEGMQVLVHRSNKPVQPWMKENSWNPETGLKNKRKWRLWWEANHRDFRVVRTAEQAFGPHR
jgi:HEAT repeats